MAHLSHFLQTRRKDEGRLAEAQPPPMEMQPKGLSALHLDLTQARSAPECRGKFMCEETLD